MSLRRLYKTAENTVVGSLGKMKYTLLVLALATLALTKPITHGDFTAYEPAQPCDHDKCKLPNCNCANTSIPGGLPANQTPQIITISFDDALRLQDYTNYYSKVFTSNRTNPNGCPIGVTFFVSHNYTDYALMEYLYYTNGYEMADHTVTHRSPASWWTNATVEELTNEIVGQAEIEENWGKIPKVYGFRAPFLASSENQIRVLYENNFTYDCSMPTQKFYWPFTFDYKSPLCNSPGVCPHNSYPGLWNIPNIDYYNETTKQFCDMLDACTGPQSSGEWYDFLMDNFNRHYKGNRAPYGLYAHSRWFYGTGADIAMKSFLDKMQEMEDVYIVTDYQLIEWVRYPTPLTELKDFKPWQCPTRPKPRCSYESPKCNHYYSDYDKLLQSCTTPCPPEWPHYGDPYGNKTVDVLL